MQYLRYWSLRHPPFAAAPDFFFAATSQRTLLAKVESLVTGNQPFSVIAGWTGCGTTTLLKNLATSSGFGDCAAEVFFTDNCLFQRLRHSQALALLLGLPPSSASDVVLGESLRASARQGVHTVWLIDNCTLSNAVSLQKIAAAHPSLAVIVVGDQSLASTLRITHPLMLGPLSIKETRDYLVQSLVMAGRTQPLFDESAIRAIHHRCGGRIKQVGELAECSLALGYRLKLKQIRGGDVSQLTRQRAA